MPQQIDNLFLVYAAIEALLIVVPILGYKIFLIIRASGGKNDTAFLFNPLSWYTLFLGSPKNASLFLAQFIILVFTIAIFKIFLTETYYENAADALSKSENFTIGQVVSNVEHPHGHSRCIVTYHYEIIDVDNIAHEYTQGWSSSACQLEPNEQVTVWYAKNHPLVSSIGKVIEPQVTPVRGEIRKIYLIVSAVMIVILIIINGGVK